MLSLRLSQAPSLNSTSGGLTVPKPGALPYSATVRFSAGIIARAPKGWTADDLAPIVNYCLDTFGAERVVFGGDWPVCLLGGPLLSWIEALEQIVAGRSAAERTALWSGNAVKFYSLNLD